MEAAHCRQPCHADRGLEGEDRLQGYALRRLDYSTQTAIMQHIQYSMRLGQITDPSEIPCPSSIEDSSMQTAWALPSASRRAWGSIMPMRLVHMHFSHAWHSGRHLSLISVACMACTKAHLKTLRQASAYISDSQRSVLRSGTRR